ncbi:MAG: MgtC/SapB family protein [Bacteroidota bacterium]
MLDLLSNILTPFLLSLIVSLGIGLIVGMQREFESISGKEHFAGMRGFAIMSMLGCVITFLAVELNINIILVVSPAIFLFICVFHYSKIQKENFGVVTELSLALVFFLGVLSCLHYIREAVAVAVIASALLTLKNKFRETLSRITQDELFAFIKFIILSFLILPILPDKNYGPGAIINPQSIGFIVVIVSSLSFIGYFIIKFFGTEKGILFTAFFGGTFSSTAVTWVFSGRSKENESFSIQYAVGIIIACTVMFTRVLIVAALFNMEVFKWLLIPCGLIILSSSAFAYFLKRKCKLPATSEPIQLGNPLDISNALLFGIQYVAITLFVYFANIYLGTKGLLITGFISGLADVDAINISMSKLSLTQINPAMAAIVILLAIVSNTIFKMGQAYFKGSNSLRKQVLIGLTPSIVIALLCIAGIYLKINV